jgi:hypothetical protein
MATAARIEPVFLSMGEVAAQLNTREFIKLAAIVDAIYGKEVGVASNVNTNSPKFAKHVIGARFDVLDIVRDAKELWVTIVTDRSSGAVRIAVK